MPRLMPGRAVLVALACVVPAMQAPTAVRVATARVDVRAEARESSPAIGDVRYGEVLPLLSAEAGWDHVTVFVGPSRVDGYVPAAATVPAPASAAIDAPLRVESTLIAVAGASAAGVSVALDAGGKTTWVAPVAPRAVPVLDEVPSAGNAGNAGKLDQLSSSANLPMMTAALDGATPMPVDPSAVVTWTWLMPTSAIVASSSARPVLTVIYTDLLGLSSDAVTPVLVRLVPIGPGWRLIAAAPGRADEPVREEADWSVARTLAEVASGQSEGGAGLMKIRLARALPPGDYAVILRPATTRALAGERVFAGSALAAGEEIVFGAVWPFHVS
jgi:hypothetical protein